MYHLITLPVFEMKALGILQHDNDFPYGIFHYTFNNTFVISTAYFGNLQQMVSFLFQIKELAAPTSFPAGLEVLVSPRPGIVTDRATAPMALTRTTA